MQCPLCTIELNEATRKGIEIDFCPKCRGVWLDSREFDKFIEHALTNPAGKSSNGWTTARTDHSDRKGFHGLPHGRRHTSTQNKSLLHDLFDY